MANPPPLPPVVDGPIFSTSTQVYVDNALPSATVTVYNDSAATSIVGTATTSASPGGVWVPLTKPLAVGQLITARQLYTGSAIAVHGLSLQSNFPVPVLPVPVPLPSPVFNSGMCTCMDSVWIGGLIPGATVTIVMETPTSPPTSTTVLNAKANQTPEWFQLSAVTIPEHAVLKAHQSVGTAKSPVVTSFPIPVAPTLEKPGLSAPPAPPPLDCQTSLDITNVVPGSDLKITQGADSASGTNPWSSYTVDGLFPLQTGTVTGEQHFTRCSQQAPWPTGSATVTKQAPKAPEVKYAPCVDITQLQVTNLLSGEVLTVAVSYNTTSGAVVTSLGAQGVGHASCTVNLPPNWYPTDATGPVTLRVAVSLCDDQQPSPGYTPVVVGQKGGPFPAPSILPPLFDCATTVRIIGAHVGSLIQVFSGTIAVPRCNPVVATTANFPITLWWPLATGESIFATQQGCNANGQSAHVGVQAIPSPLPTPTVVGPVLSGAASVPIRHVVPGARVTLFVDGAPRMGVDSVERVLTLPGGTPPVIEISMLTGSPVLTPGETLTAAQALCGEIGTQLPGQGGGVTVQAPVPDPAGGLNGSSNYFFTTSDCQNLTGVSVTIEVHKDIVYGSTTSGPSGCTGITSPLVGFSFQLNCYSPAKGKPYAAFQQYVLAVQGNQLQGLINTYAANSAPIILSSGSYQVFSIGVPTAGTLPAGYTMQIILGNDSSGNVNAVTFVVNGTKYPTPPPQTILSIPGVPATPSPLAPITAFTLDLTGPGCSQAVVLNSGAGSFTYSASSPLTVVSANPSPGCTEYHGGTAEHSTSSYGILPANPGNPFTQTFTVSGTVPKIVEPLAAPRLVLRLPRKP